MEGNTLTISETKVVLEDGLTVGGKPLRDLYETTGHGAAYDFMVSLSHKRTIRVEDIKAIHRIFYQQIDAEQAGVWRKRPILVTGTDYVFPAPHEIEGFMNQMGAWMKEERDTLNPIEFAALLHLRLVSIHPFVDGNGRTSRLVMNLALLQDGYQLALIPPICRADYLATVRRYQRKGDSKTGLMLFRIWQVKKSRIKRRQGWQKSWRTCRTKNTPGASPVCQVFLAS